MRIAVLGSTRGTVLDALIEAVREKALEVEIVLVISNKANALILEKAAKNGIPAHFYDPKNLSRENYDKQLSIVLKDHAIDLIVLIGYMRILSASFVMEWEDKIINLHPSLLPKFAGLKDLEVHHAVIASKEKLSGCTVHYVVEEVDAGPVILQADCQVFASDSPETLKARVQALEADLLINAIKKLLTVRRLNHDKSLSINLNGIKI